ncbi:MAG: CRISPR-associated helicase Cas3', partial [Nitrosotalea sp.]
NFLDDDAKWKLIINTVEKDLKKQLEQMKDMEQLFHGNLDPDPWYRRKLIPVINKNNIEFNFYVMLKGLLLRLDHSASAGVCAEIKSSNYSSKQLDDFMIKKRKKEIKPDDIWQKQHVMNYLDSNVIFQAGTGQGKTEFALYWLNGSKAFYTLPIRTSVNAMYTRLRKTFDSNEIGLLHSDNKLYLLQNDKDDGITDSISVADESRQLSMPITVSTADQLFTAVFRYPGYEKIYSTLAYSKLVVDEIQSYNPDMVAAILKCLADLSKIGCKFCMITATLPEMYLEYIKNNTDVKIADSKFKDSPRHRLKLIDGSIDDNEAITLIEKLNREYDKVLVIANTVKMSIRIKKLLDERRIESSLLHSRFIYEDRNKKENDEKFGILNAKKGLWITTQVVEVSVDIDFDIMVTEISTIDSQVQRWGRIWRNREDRYKKDIPNIYITKKPSDNGKIYDESIVEKTLSEIEDNTKNTLSDKCEYSMIQNIFNIKNMENSNYKKKFDKSIKMLEEYNYAVESKTEAQRLFRDISDISIIPTSVYKQNKEKLDESINNLDNKEKRLQSLVNLKMKSVSIPYYAFKDIEPVILNENYKIKRADVKYSFDFGVELKSYK